MPEPSVTVERPRVSNTGTRAWLKSARLSTVRAAWDHRLMQLGVGFVSTCLVQQGLSCQWGKWQYVMRPGVQVHLLCSQSPVPVPGGRAAQNKQAFAKQQFRELLASLWPRSWNPAR